MTNKGILSLLHHNRTLSHKGYSFIITGLNLIRTCSSFEFVALTAYVAKIAGILNDNITSAHFF